MDYKEKYEIALERAKEELGSGSFNRGSIEYIFPELAESEDEKIKNKLINLIKMSSEVGGFALHKWEADEMLAWLEKQGEQKSANMVEPKFHIGDWVMFNNKHQSIYQVEKIEDGYYILRHTYGGTFRVCVLHDESLRLWTIQDARDGDVLVYKGSIENSNGIKYERICLFSSLNKAFFTLTKTSNFVEDYGVNVNIDYPNNTIPATKGQKEILFMAMKEAGYKWNGKEIVLIKDAIFN